MPAAPYLVTPKRRLADPARLAALADWLGAPLPPGYAEHVTELGAGLYDGRLIVWLPDEIMAATADEQAFVREWFDELWEEEDDLRLDEAARAVPFGQTIDGDKVFYSPARAALFVLPRHDVRAYWMPRGFADPLDWGPHAPPPPSPAWRSFDSGLDRVTLELFTAQSLALADVIACVERHAPAAHRQDAAWGAVLYVPALHGRVQLTQAPGDTRVRVRIDHDVALDALARALQADLEAMGFFSVGTAR